MLENTSQEAIEKRIALAQEALFFLKQKSWGERAEFMLAVAAEIDNLDDELIKTAQEETNLPESRLRNEKARTVFQWRSYAEALRTGNALNIRIETKDINNALKPDLRKTYTPLGICVVFGASNFPFAYSTLGGDTASAIAAGCPVILNAHSAHQQTSILMASAMEKAIAKTNFHEGVFSHILSADYANGTFLVAHPQVKAVGFTGSFSGGKALYDVASKREEPIPVFAEMGSVNPVFVLPKKLANNIESLATQYVASLTLGVGQFCTNPGLLFLPQNENTATFLSAVENEIKKVPAVAMLHAGIAKTYHEKSAAQINSGLVKPIASVDDTDDTKGHPIIVTTDAQTFLSNDSLAQEVFGPFGMIVTYQNESELTQIALKIEGQLTATVWAEELEIKGLQTLLSLIQEKCGRFIFNGFPTGVEVALSMQHGGPYPSTTDSRFSSVGGDAIRRFARPLSFQNWPNDFLPDELKDENPLGLWRTINGSLSKEPISSI